MDEDRYNQEERWTRIPQPRISFQVAPPLAPVPLNRVFRHSPNVNLLITSSTGYPCLTAGMGLSVETQSLLNAFMFSLRGELKTTAQGGTGDRLTPGGHRVKLEESCMTLAKSICYLKWIHHVCIWLKGSWAMRLSPLI